MNTLKLSLLFPLLVLVLAACNAGGGAANVPQIELAADTQNLVLICDDSEDCNTMGEALTEIAASYGDSVNYVRGSMDGSASEFSQERGIQAFPTIVLIGEDGTDLFTLQGVLEPDYIAGVVEAFFGQ